MTKDDDARQRPGRSDKGREAEAARKERLAQQLRANLAKRKRQQRDRRDGEAPEEAGG